MFHPSGIDGRLGIPTILVRSVLSMAISAGETPPHKQRMTDQPVPEVTDEDVKRIALRDFGEDQLPLALSILDEFGKQDWNPPGARVRLAILKLAKVDLDRRLDGTQAAINDYRDVLSAAEYPRYSREVGFREVSKEVKQAIIEDDWKQYREWLAK